MKTAGPAVALAALIVLGCRVARGADLYISPAGDDGNPGTLEQPLATLEGARHAVRALRRNGGPRGRPLVVQLRGGTYRLDRTEVFTPLDSGTEREPIVYEAFPGERPILSGGVPITGWRRHDERLWVADVPWATALSEPFAQLFVNGLRRPRARTPNEGAYFYSQRLHMDGPPTPSPSASG